MNRKELFEQIQAKKSMLCVGLDVDYNKMPEHVKALAKKGEVAIKGELFKGTARSIVEFNKAIVDATAPYCVAYKPNIAFYEAEGVSGWQQLEMTVDYIRKNYPEMFIIADAKRGDIGNTAALYAKAFFEKMDFDAVTLAPYMGRDAIKPFLEYEGKWVIVLALTSNPSAEDFETKVLEDGRPLFREVIENMNDVVMNLLKTPKSDALEDFLSTFAAICPAEEKEKARQQRMEQKEKAAEKPVEKNTEKPTREILKNQIRTLSFCEIGRRYAVSDNTIRKWCNGFGLPFKKSEIVNYTDEDWSKV